MARSKKTALEEQPNEALDTGMELIQPETEEPLFPQSEWDDSQSEDSPPPDFQPGLDPCGTEDPGWPDPQTDPELYQAENTDESAPDTDPEAGEPDMPRDVPDDTSQTIPEPAEEPVEAAPDGDDSQPVPSEEMPVEALMPYAENESLPETEAPLPSEPAPAQPKRLRMPRQRRDARIVSIDAERSVETDTDRLRSDLLDLVESMKGRKILTDMVQGVERPSPDSELSYAVIYHGAFKVIIPVQEMVEEPEDYRGQPRGDVLHYLLNKRLGAEVDYIVKGVDQETGVAAASRLEAMAKKRKEYYFRTDQDGNYQIYASIRAEARVVSVIRAGIFIDLFGAETYIPLKELSYQRWVDAAAHYQPGQRVLVKVLEVDRSDRNKPHVTASVKQAGENPYEKALQRYSVGSRYVGTVSLVDLNGVFVSLDGGIDCLCTHPPRGRPPRGARVTVRILGINHDSNRIWGAITHMSTTR